MRATLTAAHKVAIASSAASILLLGLPAVSSADPTSATNGASASTVAATSSDSAASATGDAYLVLYKGTSVPADAAARMTAAGGTLVKAYDAIGVAVARSAAPGFAAAVQSDTRVEGVSATAKFGSKVEDVQAADGPQPGDLPNTPAADGDTLSALQWDMRQIHTPEAHAITGGSRAVVAATIDTGLDFTHPDIAPNYSSENSADCTSGEPTPLLPGNDRNGHGTHTGGTIAAAANGTGIVGVAPNVRIAGIKSATDAGFFFPEMVVCAFMWAGDHHIDVTNNSYYADPFLYNCRNDKVQHAIWKAEQRAIRYAMNQGVTVVASEGNDSTDHSHPTTDPTSPDFPPGNEVVRDITNACVVVPLEIPGVIGVTADGNTPQIDKDDNVDYLKSFYSSYGVSTADVVAPGGDSIYGRTPQAPNGRVLSTWPSGVPCLRSVKEPPADPGAPTTTYCYLQGTSMAGPHVAGVAALVVSRFGDASNPQNGKLRPTQVEQYVTQTADTQPCPTALPPGYATNFPQLDGSAQTCAGGPGHTSWYGVGQVNALRAVTHDTSNGR